MRLVKGQGLTKMMDDNEESSIVSHVYIGKGVVTDIWYHDIMYYLL